MASPLADRLRPRTLDEVVGQQHLLAPGRSLRRIIESGQIPNMIFYGPSGVGKTTVARIIAAQTKKRLHRLNGTNASLSDIKAIVEELDSIIGCNGVLLYLDEIQYLNKKQQQSLLEYIEDGRITLIASTTENPYFYIYNAVLSRSTVFEFKSVPPEEAEKAVNRGFDIAQEELDEPLLIEPGVTAHIARSCGGDVRKALNTVELLTLSASLTEEGRCGNPLSGKASGSRRPSLCLPAADGVRLRRCGARLPDDYPYRQSRSGRRHAGRAAGSAALPGRCGHSCGNFAQIKYCPQRHQCSNGRPESRAHRSYPPHPAQAGLDPIAANRKNDDPVIFAGGPCAMNAEPLCDFFDCFQLGEGEEIMLEMIDLYQKHRASGNWDKKAFLRDAAQIPGMYVPSLYDVSYHEDGTIAAVTPKDGAPAVITKRIVQDFDKAFYPETFIVPYTEVVHDRGVLEVMRGCIP